MNWIYAAGTLIIAHLTGLPTSTNGQNQGKSFSFSLSADIIQCIFYCKNLFTITGKLSRKTLAKRSLDRRLEKNFQQND